jgi:hypothetical protein
MLIKQEFVAVAAILLTGDSIVSIVSAQVGTIANCLALGYSQCWCNCQIPLINQYCPVTAQITECSCTNTDYHSQIELCLESASCAGLTGGLATASSICAKYGYSLVLSAPSTVALASTGASSGPEALNTVSGTLVSHLTGATGSNGGSPGITTLASSSQGSAASPSYSSGSLKPGAIAGIVIGSIAVLVIGILGTIFLLQRGGSRNKAAAVIYRD